MKAYEPQFRQFLADARLEQSTINNYCNVIINYVDGYITKYIDSTHTCMLDIIDAEHLEILHNSLYDCEPFITESIRKHNSFTAAINNYLDFAHSLKMDNVEDDSVCEEVLQTATLPEPRPISKIEADIADFTKYGTNVPETLKAEYESAKGEEIIHQIIDNLHKAISTVVQDITIPLKITINYNPKSGLTITDENDTIVKNKLSPAAHPSYKKTSARDKIIVTLPDGTIIDHNKVKDTITDFVKYAGLERVSALKILYLGQNLVETSLLNNYYTKAQVEVAPGFWLNTCSSTPTKKAQIDLIASRLGLKIKTKLISK